MKVKIIVLTIAAFFVGVGYVMAQETNFDITMSLEKISYPNDYVTDIGKRCGDYFRYVHDSETPFIVAKAKSKKIGKNVAKTILMMQKRNVETRIFDKSIPVLEISEGPRFVLWISYPEYKKAKECLPEPPNSRM